MPATPHFFLAVCSCAPHPRRLPSCTADHGPTSLRERRVHIGNSNSIPANLRQEKEHWWSLFRVQEAALEDEPLSLRPWTKKLAGRAARIVNCPTELVGAAVSDFRSPPWKGRTALRPNGKQLDSKKLAAARRTSP